MFIFFRIAIFLLNNFITVECQVKTARPMCHYAAVVMTVVADGPTNPRCSCPEARRFFLLSTAPANHVRTLSFRCELWKYFGCTNYDNTFIPRSSTRCTTSMVPYAFVKRLDQSHQRSGFFPGFRGPMYRSYLSK